MLILAFFSLLLSAYFDSARFKGIDRLVQVCQSILSKGSNSVIRKYKQGRELEHPDPLGRRTKLRIMCLR